MICKWVLFNFDGQSRLNELLSSSSFISLQNQTCFSDFFIRLPKPVMAIPSQPKPLAYVETVEEIMKIYSSLPPRPTLDEVQAAIAVIRTVKNEEQMRVEEISRQEKPPDVPEELFLVLQEFKKNFVLFQSYEHMKEALGIVDLDNKFEVFDELIQSASKLVPVEDQKGRVELVLTIQEAPPFVNLAKTENEKHGDDETLTFTVKQRGERSDSDVSSSLLHNSSMKADGDAEKLSLMKVATLIETSAKNGIEVLDLQGKLMDQIEWLPVTLGKLSNIMNLNLADNQIMALPHTINSLKALTKLDIHSNQLINLPDSFGELSNLVDLDLHGNRLRSLPVTFGNLSSLANIDLSTNRLLILPETFGNLTSLKRLNIETNDIEEFPYTIGSCSSLIELHADFNRLKALPEAIGKLESLEILTLHYNRIKALPTTMGSLSKLKELDVSFNELETIPESLCFATRLVILNVGRNFADLRTLPRSIGSLERLEELDISNNQIRVLPDSFRLLSNLRVLYADETPLELPPRQIAKLGAQAVVQYMEEFVVKRDSSSRPAKKKGFWTWFCLMFCLLRKKQSIDSTKA